MPATNYNIVLNFNFSKIDIATWLQVICNLCMYVLGQVWLTRESLLSHRRFVAKFTHPGGDPALTKGAKNRIQAVGTM